MADKNVIELIKALRERTGAGMMDCKHALEANGYDIEKSVDDLREKGIVKQAKRANRTAAEGLTNVKFCDKCGCGAVIELNCETDFVAGSDKFIDLVKTITDVVLKNQPKSLEEAQALVATSFNDTALAVGEKLSFRRFALLSKKPEQAFASYIHMGGKISVLAVMEKPDDEVSKAIAMHIAANSPLYINLEDVPAADRARETAIAEQEVKDDPKLQSKPEAVKNQIVIRKVDKVLSTSCLALQPFLLDESKTVGQYLTEKGNKVVSFVRYQVGEGIVKDPTQVC
jgi:elongation factor Ts